jgi:hypothetical protein
MSKISVEEFERDYLCKVEPRHKPTKTDKPPKGAHFEYNAKGARIVVYDEASMSRKERRAQDRQQKKHLLKYEQELKEYQIKKSQP